MSKVVSWRNLSQCDKSIPKDPPAKVALDMFDVVDFDMRHYTKASLTLQLEFVQKIDLKDLEQYVKAANTGYSHKEEAVAAANLFFTKHIFSDRQHKFSAGKTRFFLETGWEEFGSPGKLVYRGYSCQVRPAMGQLMLNVNTSTGLFYEQMTVANSLNLKLDPTELLGLRVWVDFKHTKEALDNDQARTKTISEIGISASEQEAYVRGEKEEQITVTVWDHMQENYHGRPNKNYNTSGNSDSICINKNPAASSTKAWFLAEDLLLLPHQMYKRKLDPKLTSLMIKKACRIPEIKVRAILSEGLPATTGVDAQKKGCKPQTFRDFGINVDPRMLKVSACTIGPPQLEFSSGQPGDVYKNGKLMLGQWQLGTDIRFLTNGQNVPGQPFFLIHNKFRGGPVPDFLKSFWTYYTTHGAPDMGQLPA